MKRYFIFDWHTGKVVMEGIKACNSYNALCIYNNFNWPASFHPDTGRYMSVRQRD